MNRKAFDYRISPERPEAEPGGFRSPARARLRVALRQAWRLGWRIGVGLFVLSLFVTLLYGFAPVPVTPLMVIRPVENLFAGRAVGFEKDWVPIEKMSPRLVSAMIAAEDWRFFEHNGFDWDAIAKALKHNERSRKIRGASTISQQVAKNVFLWPQRSWLRKGLEAYFTALIELVWSKRRIMEVYLNVVELGDGVYGVEAASRKYFKKPAAQLSAAEAALVASVLPNPRRFLIAKPSSYVRFRQTLILRRMPSAAQEIPAGLVSGHQN
jgi:monofunctional biosynthetic peptidoglycan transglycosylase